MKFFATFLYPNIDIYVSQIRNFRFWDSDKRAKGKSLIVYNICSISNPVSDRATNKSVLNIERSQYH